MWGDNRKVQGMMGKNIMPLSTADGEGLCEYLLFMEPSFNILQQQ